MFEFETNKMTPRIGRSLLYLLVVLTVVFILRLSKIKPPVIRISLKGFKISKISWNRAHVVGNTSIICNQTENPKKGMCVSF